MNASLVLIVSGVSFGIILASLFSHIMFVVSKEIPFFSSSSHCTACGERQHLYSRIPIAGSLFLNGECPKCGFKPSLFSSLLEFLILSFSIWAFLNLSPVSAVQISLLFAALLGIAVMDMKKWIIPNLFVLLIIIAGVLGVASGTVSLLHSIIGLGVATVVALFIVIPQKLGAGDNTLALGDVKLCLAVALWLGWILSTYVFFLASLFAFFAWVITGFFNGFSVQRRLQFGPFVALATLIFGIGRVLDPQFVTHLLTFRF